MRVITGLARGRKLTTLKGDDVRPTTDLVKEAVFSIIQFELDSARVLDLFAGSGQMGIEALSRGARECVFVDNSAKSIAVVKKNLQHTGLISNAKIITADYLSYLEMNIGTFDIVFLDPPYSKNMLQKALPKLPGKMNKGGVIICESPKDEILPENIENFSIYKRYRYGKICITVYRESQD